MTLATAGRGARIAGRGRFLDGGNSHAALDSFLGRDGGSVGVASRSVRGRGRGRSNNAERAPRRGRSRDDSAGEMMGNGGGRGGGYKLPESMGRRSGGPLRRGARDAAWLADDVRELATEGLRAAAADASEAARRRASAASIHAFEGSDFSALLQEVPSHHWAAAYLEEVAATLEMNADIAPASKLALLNDTIHLLHTSAAQPGTVGASSAEQGVVDNASAGVQDQRFADADEELDACVA